MGKSSSYFSGKLFDINYRIAIHEGDANRRLASEVMKIRLLPADEVPDRFKLHFRELRTAVEATIRDLPAPGLIPTRIRGIQNRTAAKYIKLLIDIQDSINNS